MTHPIYSRAATVRLTRGDDKQETFQRAVDQAGFVQHVLDHWHASGKPQADFRIAIKPNIMTASTFDANSPVYTDPTLVEALIELLRAQGFERFSVVESQNVYNYAYQGRTVPAVAEMCGYSGDGYEIVEARFRQHPHGAPLEDVRKRLALTRAEADSASASLAGAGRLCEVGPGAFIHADVLEGLEQGITATLTDYQARNKLEWGMSKEELREKTGLPDGLLNWVLERLAGEGAVFARKGKVRVGSSDVELSPGEAAARKTVLRLLEDRMFQTPSEADIAKAAGTDGPTLRKVMSLLVEEGEVVKLDAGVYLHGRAIEEATRRVSDYLNEHGEATMSELKNALGTTRKYAVPILEYLDRLGVTRRAGDKRKLI